MTGALLVLVLLALPLIVLAIGADDPPRPFDQERD
jgi:hypothetical protein